MIQLGDLAKENSKLPDNVQLTITQLIFRELDSGYNQIYAVIIVVWATLVTESWKRKENTLANSWLMRDFSDTTLERPKFRPQLQIDEDLRDVVRLPRGSSYLRFLLVGLPVTVLFMGMTAYCVLHTKYAYDKAYKTVDAKDIPFIASFGVSMANTVYITVFALAFKYVAQWLTEFEDHQWEQSHENSLIAKIILFYFVNAYIANFIYAFWDKDFMLLAKNVATILFFSQIFSSIIDFLLDRILVHRNMNKV